MSETLTVTKTGIEGLLKIQRPIFSDERGMFHEVFRLNELESFGIKFSAVQWNHSISKPRVIRAIHSENWQKIVYPVNGEIFIAIVDLRKESADFAKIETFTIDNTDLDAPRTAFYLPPGVGNSICVVGDKPIDYMYLVDEYWQNDKAKGIAWDDPDLNIPWPVSNPIISKRDMDNPTLRQIYPEKFK